MFDLNMNSPNDRIVIVAYSNSSIKNLESFGINIIQKGRLII